jgi:transposase
VIEPDLQEQAIAVLKENKSYPTRKNDRKYLLTADCDVRCAGYRRCMSAYSLALREKIVEPVKKGVPKSETARPFGVDRATVKRYCKQLDECGTLEPRKAPGKRSKLDEKARNLLLEDLQERPWATHSQRAEFLFAACGVSVSEATVCRTLRRLSRSRKKIQRGTRTRRVLETPVVHGGR